LIDLIGAAILTIWKNVSYAGAIKWREFSMAFQTWKIYEMCMFVISKV
jgi:hypothetical protein